VEDITYTDGTRHSFATWLGAAGVPDERIGRLLGHAARSVTRRHYVGDDIAKLQEAVEKIVLDVFAAQVLTLPLAMAQEVRRWRITGTSLPRNLPRAAVSEARGGDLTYRIS
jgi:hypothetical protein